MRLRSCTAALALGCVLPAMAGFTRRAVAVCTAADIVTQDTACPNDSGPCTISKPFTINDNCEFDFGSREVTLSGVLDIQGGALTIKAGSLTIAASGRVAGSVGIFATRTVTNAGQIEVHGEYGEITVDSGGDIIGLDRGIFTARGRCHPFPGGREDRSRRRHRREW